MDKLQLAAFVLMLTWCTWDLFVRAMNDGKPKIMNPLTMFTSTIITVVLLYFGGFFADIFWPHIFWFVLTAVGLMATCAGYFKDEKYGFFSSVFAYIIFWFLLLKGGFWYKGFVPFQ